MNLANKYRPSTWDDVCEQSVVTKMLRSICEADELTNRNFLLVGPAGCGKAQPLYSKVLTPDGFVSMGDVKLGDSVITRTGEIASIIGVYPQGKRKIYEITLQDRTKIRVADNHLNSVYVYNQDKKQREDYVLTTEELISFIKTSRFKVRVDTPEIDCWKDSILPMDPYLVGALIGDGSLHHNNIFSNSEPDVIDKVSTLLKDWDRELVYQSNYDYSISLIGKHAKYVYTYNSNEYTYSEIIKILVSEGYPKFSAETLYNIANGTAVHYNKKYPELQDKISVRVNSEYNVWNNASPFKQTLQSLDLLVKSVDKHIPKQYLYASKETRLALLRGLFDTDGHIGKNGAVEYSTCSPKLSEDFAFLVRSLGIRDTIIERPAKYNSGDKVIYTGSTSYRHCLKVPNGLKFYTSQKHCARYRNRQFDPIRNIVDISFIGYEDCQCIMVDHPDHTYISDDFIPTHNTTLGRVMAHTLNGADVEPIEVDGASNNGVDSIRNLIQQASQYPVGCKWKIIIVDECFSRNTLISTIHGQKPIQNIHIGDTIYGLNGESRVKNIFKNRVKTNHLVCVKVGDTSIITTKDHLFFTNEGWVCAKDLKSGDILYDYTSMQTMRSGISCQIFEQQEMVVQSGMSSSIYEHNNDGETFKFYSKKVSDMWKRILDDKKHKCNNLFYEVWNSMEEAESKYGTIVGTTCKTLALIYLSDMWQRNGDNEQRSSSHVFSSMCSTVESSEKCAEDCTKYVSMVWEYIYNELQKSTSKDMFREMQICIDSELQRGTTGFESIYSNEDAQSDVKSRYCCKDGGYQTEKWDITPEACIAWWKWTSDKSTNAIKGGIGTELDIRISCCNRGKTQSKPKSLSYELQVRPRISRIMSGDRGGWCAASDEILAVIRRKEDEFSSKYWVDSVEVYKRGYNEELFSSSFTDSELHNEYVTMYDLEVDGHPSYFANGVLVHNCHAITPAAWASLLKTLEENLAKTIWIFCTTNPEKIPATILSRVQVFQLSKISLKGIEDRLKYVLDSEISEGRDISYDTDAILYIAKMAKGGMRDALTLTDKVLTYDTHISLLSAKNALNLPDFDTYFALLSAYSKKDNESIISIVDEAYNSGLNFVTWFENFHSFVIGILKYIFTQDISATMIPPQYETKLKSYSSAHANVCIKLSTILLMMISKLKTTNYQTEVAYTYLCRMIK